MKKKILYISLDVYKKSIDVAITDQHTKGGFDPIAKLTGLEALDKLIRKLKSTGAEHHIVYEAVPCGYLIYGNLTSRRHSYLMLVPSLVPRKSCDRIKGDTHDAVKLMCLFRAGEFTSIFVPTSEEETIQDLFLCPVEMRRIER
jgi:hypothetical protein